jgi:hypothetical protein
LFESRDKTVDKSVAIAKISRNRKSSFHETISLVMDTTMENMLNAMPKDLMGNALDSLQQAFNLEVIATNYTNM